jgi:putative nucleotidyltransferase with HDIG domain
LEPGISSQFAPDSVANYGIRAIFLVDATRSQQWKAGFRAFHADVEIKRLAGRVLNTGFVCVLFLPDPANSPACLERGGFVKQKIDTRSLQFGMHVVELDRPWTGTRFIYREFVIETKEVLDELRRVSAYVYIETDPKLRPSSSQSPSDSILVEKSDTLDDDNDEDNDQVDRVLVASSRHIETRWHPDETSLEEELHDASRIEARTREILYDTLEDVKLGKSIRMSGAREAIAEMAESIIRNPDAMVVLSQLKEADEYTALHSLRVCILALTFGRHLDFSREELNMLGIGALLHDVGKMRVPSDVLNKPGRLTDEEFELMKSHVPEGVKILAKAEGIPEASIQVAAQHHERYAGGGYANGVAGDKIGTFGLVSGIVDCYDAITSDRVYHSGMSPYEALTSMYSWRNTDFHPGLIEQFIQCMGIYPVGSLVELSDGSIGVVINVNRRRRLRPRVALVLKPNKKPYRLGRIVNLKDLEEQDGSSATSVVKVLQPGEYGINPVDYLPMMDKKR